MPTMAFRLRSLSTASKRTLLASSWIKNPPHHYQPTIIYYQYSLKPRVAPILELERRLNNRHQNMDRVLGIYESEKQNFLSSNCWVATVEHLFRTDPKRRNVFKFRTINKVTVQHVPSIDEARTRRVEAFLNDLTHTMETKNIEFFGRQPTAHIARILSTDTNAALSPAVHKFVDLAGQNIEVLVDRGNPLEVADVMTALARLNLRETFETALNFLQSGSRLKRLHWLLTKETTPLMVWSCARMNNQAPKLFRIVSSRPELSVGPHMSIPHIIETLNGFIKQGHFRTTLFDRVIEFHRHFIKNGKANDLASLAEAIRFAERTDCTVFFEALCERADYFATHGTASDFAKTLKAASIVMKPNTIPALACAIDRQAHRILKEYVSQPYMPFRRLADEQEQQQEQHQDDTQPSRPSQTELNNADIINAINNVIVDIKSKRKTKQHKVEEEKKAKSSMKSFATIVYAYSLLQHACPEFHNEVENNADVIVARATSKQQEMIAKSFETMGCEIPKFKEAMILCGQQSQQQDAPLVPPQQNEHQSEEGQLMIQA